MPKETNNERLKLLRRVLSDPASNVVLFKDRAFTGSGEPDDPGLDEILPAKLSRPEKADRLKAALAAFLEAGGVPNRIEYEYEDRDPELIYEFRFQFEAWRLYVKTELKEDDPADPILVIRSVKRQN